MKTITLTQQISNDLPCDIVWGVVADRDYDTISTTTINGVDVKVIIDEQGSTYRIEGFLKFDKTCNCTIKKGERIGVANKKTQIYVRERVVK